MKFHAGTRTRFAIFILTAYALILTVVVGMVTLNRGGAAYMLEKLHIVKPKQIYSQTSISDINRFALYPNSKGKIVFLGDSITAQTNWAEYFSYIQNRGIGGETSLDVLKRVRLISNDHPKAVFLNIGTNDLAKGIDPQRVFSNVTQIVGALRASDKNTAVYLVSVLPNNPRLLNSALMIRKTKQIIKLNALLKDGAKSLGAQYVDVYPEFVDSDGYLKKDFTTDGTHLTERGKAAYAVSITRSSRDAANLLKVP